MAGPAAPRSAAPISPAVAGPAAGSAAGNAASGAPVPGFAQAPPAPALPAATSPAPPASAPPAAATSKSLRVLLPACVGAVALVVVVVLLVKGLTGASGGAGSPTAAIRQLAAAAQADDPAAAIALVDPGEARTLGTLYTQARDAVRASGADGASGGALSGTHVSIHGLQLHEEQLGSGVARVRITGGKIEAALQAVALPAALGAISDSHSATNLADAPGPGGLGLFLMTRKQEGRWYISPTLTVMQYIVETNHLAPPDFAALETPGAVGHGEREADRSATDASFATGGGSAGGAAAADGASSAANGAGAGAAASAADTSGGEGATDTASPAQLAEQLAQAISSSDVSGVLGLISEREASALRPYSAALQELVSRAGGSLQFQVTAPQFSETPLSGNLVRLNILHTGFSLGATGDESSFSDGESSDEENNSGGAGGERGIDGTLNGPCLQASELATGEASSASGCFARMSQLLGVEDFFVVAERASGGLRLAPLATFMEYARLLVKQLGGAGVSRLSGTAAQQAPAGTLAAGTRTSGRLNAAGYTVLAYHASAAELLALESNQGVALLEPDGRPALPLACPDGNELYRLGSAGTYRVVLAATHYQPAGFSVLAEPIHASSVGVPSNVSGSVGNGARIVALALAIPPSGASLTTTSSVYSQFVGPNGNPENLCGGSNLAAVLGPESLLHPPAVVQPSSPSPGIGNASSVSESAPPGHDYLVISGPPGTHFNGTVSPTSGGAE